MHFDFFEILQSLKRFLQQLSTKTWLLIGLFVFCFLLVAFFQVLGLILSFFLITAFILALTKKHEQVSLLEQKQFLVQENKEAENRDKSSAKGAGIVEEKAKEIEEAGK